MGDLDLFISPVLNWIFENPFFTGALAILFALSSAYSKTIVQSIAKIHLDKFLEARETDDQVFDDQSDSLLQKLTEEELKALSSNQLIEFYGEEHRPFDVQIGSTNWRFAATRIIEPLGDGSVEKQKISIKYRDEWFELDDELDWLTAHRLKALVEAKSGEQLFNGDPFRIISVQKEQDGWMIEVGRCKYYDSLRTNFSMDLVLPRQGKTLRDILHAEVGSFGSLDASRLPNHMGLVVIIETSDGQLIFQERSAKVQVRPGTLSASVSGTFEKSDLTANTELIQLNEALGGLTREMHGELGGRPSFNPENFYFLGLMREFRRGGFPDFYFYFLSDKTFREIEKSAKDAEEAFEIDNLHGFYVGSQEYLRNPNENRQAFDQRVDQMMRAVEGRANLTLTLGIALFYDATIRRASKLEG